MEAKKEDRRSKRTRKLLSDALVALLLEKRYDKITVQDILDRADVGRSTFYSHYQGKEDLLVSDFEQMLDMLSQHVEEGQASSPKMFSSLDLFQHVQEHYHLYKAMVWGRGVELLFSKGHAYLSQKIEQHLTEAVMGGQQPSVPLEIISEYLAGAFLTLLKWWLDHDLPQTPEQMDQTFQQLVMPGMLAALPKN
jgi:AcrR family transcriptional regulator